ncbi:MAG: hypothetical protein MJE77_29555 [Proteobacteria bacterium]|nr:hypothetical protein [Pseudomonadota bacterium]
MKPTHERSNVLFAAAAIAAVAVSVALLGCGDDDDELNAAEDACEHMKEGPSQAVTAATDNTGDAPDIGEEHTRFDITLSGQDSYIDLVIDEEGEFTVFMDKSVPIAVSTSSGAPVAAEQTNSNVTECAEVSIGHTFDFEVGTYSVNFGSTAEQQVRLVVVHEGEHMHE